jgi:DNA gyrase inhibitor GyrI
MLWQKSMMFRPSDSRETSLQDGTAWLLAWQEQRHGDAYILGVVIHMTKKTCRDVCKYMIYTVIEGHDLRSGESSGTSMPTGLSAVAGQQGQRAQDKNISLSYLIL